MKKVPYTNQGETTLHIDGKRIEPNQTRDVDPSKIPESTKTVPTDEPADVSAPDSVTAILDKNIPEIVPLLHDMTDEDLAEIKAAEEAGKTRAGLMKAIGEEELRRANDKVPNPGDESISSESGGGDSSGSETSAESPSEDDSTGEQ